jgi:Protein of unknown function (DUF3499)
MSNRPCSRISCPEQAVATLTFVYADSMAVLGPLSATHEPHTYDLCDRHAQRTSAPKGWQVVRHKVMGDLFDGAGSGA